MTIRIAASLLLALASSVAEAQYFGAVWKGRVGEPGPGRTWEVELKLDAAGDSVKGVSYYRGAYYRELRMPVKGYVDARDGSLSWWHASDHGTDIEGKVALDPMPHGIRYRLSQKKDSDSTQRLEGEVSMSLWSGEKWEREVFFVRASSDRSTEWENRVNVNPKTQPIAKSTPKAAETKNKPAKPSKPTATTEKSKPAATVKTEPTTKPEKEKTPAMAGVAEAAPGKMKIPATSPTVPKKTGKEPDSTAVASKSPPPAKPVAVKPEAQPKPAKPATASKESANPKSVTKTSVVAKSSDKPKTDGRVESADTSVSQPPKKTESLLPAEPVSASESMTPLRSRPRMLVEEVVVQGDTLWLNFYDPAEVDGDTVSVYLGDEPVATKIGLGLKPHLIGIPVVSLPDSALLTMFAENMGSIPPNTALLVLYIAGERREVRLESSDRTSATVRFLRPSPPKRL